MLIKEIFSFYDKQDAMNVDVDLVKLKNESKEYIDRMHFFIVIFGNTILIATVFIFLFVSEFDIRLGWGYVLLILLGCVWSIFAILFFKKKERLKQIISYPNYRCISAKCTHVNQVNMLGITYEFIMSEAPFHRFQVNALRVNNYVMDVREGDEVCIMQFFSTYNVVFSTRKNLETRTCNDIVNIFSMSNFNRRQRNAFLVCYISASIIMGYIIADIIINNSTFPADISK